MNNHSIDLLSNGLKDKKQNLRKTWTVSLGKALIGLSTPTSSSLDIFKKVSASLVATINECDKSPLPAVTNKLIAGGYASVAILSQLQKLTTDESLLSTITSADLPTKLSVVEGKDSILTNVKLYIKYVSEDEQEWFVRALAALVPSLTAVSKDYGAAWLYSCLSTNIHPSVRRLAVQLLEESNNLNQKFTGESCVESLIDYLKSAKTEEKDELNYNFKRILPFISAITKQSPTTSKESLELLLVKLLVPANHKALSYLKSGWVGISQRAQVDPGHVVAKYSSGIVKFTTEILLHSDEAARESGIFAAACKAISLVSFISTGTIIPLLTPLIDSDLDITSLQEIDDEKLAIWKGKEGELVIDVLAKSQKKPVIDKNSKDYETLKWEQSVRKEVKAKKQVVKKLTKEEQAQVNEQLSLESKLRKSVSDDYNKLSRAMNIIIALSVEAETVDNGTKSWFPVAISRILDILKSESAKKLVGALATDCFLNMARVFTTVNGLSGTSKMNWVGATTLRLYDIEHVPAVYTGKDLNEILTSQLFSLKLSSDKVRFDSLTLMFILPLLVKVIENGTVYTLKHKKVKTQVRLDTTVEEPEEEQLSLAIEIVSSHCEVFQDDSIPRTAILEHLLTLLTVPTKAKLSKDCFLALAQNISVNTSSTDLKLIISKVISPIVFVRTAVLEALDEEFDLTELKFNEELFIACFDNEETNKEIAETIWEDNYPSVRLLPTL
ncbi:unnamed protein product [Ambrosiozyma monospora]|uniref:Unnamed protein product n=1 Tax=Ambrosiozyma monospora TaxID=43982 RepID=A0ACB5T0H2_AMBMO|nr:unnamed protein product [Ambrosiozyma monospora]